MDNLHNKELWRIWSGSSVLAKYKARQNSALKGEELYIDLEKNKIHNNFKDKAANTINTGWQGNKTKKKIATSK